ncbi:MAG: SufD family Fe-S cluster assembly protein [Patescibacteria group bacterium]|nr:SufD family Fe-S cluster assembly protein [Patescibacteria group bacterium]
MNILKLNSIEKNIIPPLEQELLIIENDVSNIPAEREIQIAAGMKAQYVLVLPKLIDIKKIIRRFDIQEGASLNAYYLFLDQNDEVELVHNLAERAQITSRSLYIGEKEEKLKVKADYNFNERSSSGRVLVDGLLNDKSQLSYIASLNVLNKAQQSDTRVDMRLRLIGPESRGQLVPVLNIAANDVKAGHSASTFQLSAEDMFYLRSRGLAPEDIQKLFALSMAKKFVTDLSDDGLKEELIHLISTRLC